MLKRHTLEGLSVYILRYFFMCPLGYITQMKILTFFFSPGKWFDLFLTHSIFFFLFFFGQRYNCVYIWSCVYNKMFLLKICWYVKMDQNRKGFFCHLIDHNLTEFCRLSVGNKILSSKKIYEGGKIQQLLFLLLNVKFYFVICWI